MTRKLLTILTALFLSAGLAYAQVGGVPGVSGGATITAPTLTGVIDATGGIFKGATPFCFDGATAGTFKTCFSITDPAGTNKTVTFPNLTGTVFLNDAANNLTAGEATANDQIRINPVAAGAGAADLIITTTDMTGADKTITFADASGTPMLSTVVNNGPGNATSVTGEANGIVFEGATGADGIETHLVATDPTAADKTVTLANASGTVVLSTLATNAPAVVNSVWGTTNALTFEGGTADAFVTNLTPEDATGASKTITLPNYDGAVVLSTLAANKPEVANGVWAASSALKFEGATADAFETSVVPRDPTAVQTITLPNATGPATLTVATVTTAVPVTAPASVLQTYTMPASTLDTDGYRVHVIAWGVTANNANAKAVDCSFGAGVAVVGIAALTVNQVNTWKIEYDVIRTGAATEIGVGQATEVNAAGHQVILADPGALAVNTAAAIDIHCDGTGVANADVTQNGLIVQLN